MDDKILGSDFIGPITCPYIKNTNKVQAFIYKSNLVTSEISVIVSQIGILSFGSAFHVDTMYNTIKENMPVGTNKLVLVSVNKVVLRTNVEVPMKKNNSYIERKEVKEKTPEKVAEKTPGEKPEEKEEEEKEENENEEKESSDESTPEELEAEIVEVEDVEVKEADVEVKDVEVKDVEVKDVKEIKEVEAEVVVEVKENIENNCSVLDCRRIRMTHFPMCSKHRSQYLRTLQLCGLAGCNNHVEDAKANFCFLHKRKETREKKRKHLCDDSDRKKRRTIPNLSIAELFVNEISTFWHIEDKLLFCCKTIDSDNIHDQRWLSWDDLVGIEEGEVSINEILLKYIKSSELACAALKKVMIQKGMSLDLFEGISNYKTVINFD